jgi:1-acyl-sn-glycerol-3-phosphate acyltransferase
MVKIAHRVDGVFIGKHTLFVGPIGWFLRKIGGIPVNRDSPRGVIGTVVDEFSKREKMIFALAPEGTRSYKDHWKSGFYRVAIRAGVPIQLCFLDKTTHTVGFGPLVYPTGDREKDLQVIREFYKDKKGIKPELFSEIRFKNEQGQ